MFVIAVAGLRELAPALRDQIMVTLRDRALIEAMTGHWRPRQAAQDLAEHDKLVSRELASLRAEAP